MEIERRVWRGCSVVLSKIVVTVCEQRCLLLCPLFAPVPPRRYGVCFNGLQLPFKQYLYTVRRGRRGQRVGAHVTTAAAIYHVRATPGRGR